MRLGGGVVRVDGDKTHAFVPVVVVEFLDPAFIELGRRAVHTSKQDRQDRPAAEIFQPVRLAVNAGKGEIRRLGTDRESGVPLAPPRISGERAPGAAGCWHGAGKGNARNARNAPSAPASMRNRFHRIYSISRSAPRFTRGATSPICPVRGVADVGVILQIRLNRAPQRQNIQRAFLPIDHPAAGSDRHRERRFGSQRASNATACQRSPWLRTADCGWRRTALAALFSTPALFSGIACGHGNKIEVAAAVHAVGLYQRGEPRHAGRAPRSPEGHYSHLVGGIGAKRLQILGGNGLKFHGFGFRSLSLLHPQCRSSTSTSWSSQRPA